MTDTQADVVIVGAGPNGLMVAGELALAGIRPVVLEHLPGPSLEPKANGLVGQVIRTLDLRGLYQRLSGQSRAPQPAPAFMFSGIPLPLNDIGDNPLYMLPIPQPDLVQHLVDWMQELGVRIDWGHELVDLTQHDDGSTLTVATDDTIHTISARYVVAADGGRSPIRKKLGIDFPGTTSDMTLHLAHVRIPDEYRSADGSLNVPGAERITPGHNRLAGGGLVFGEFQAGRPLIGTIEFGRGESGDTITLDDVRDSVARVIGAELPLDAPIGPGPHALRKINGQNTRLAQRYRDGNVFLVGDAAHVHSAMGGPGLNLGLQDAMNLGWKLAATLNGWAPAGLLDTYFTERYPVAERVMTQSMAQTALMAPGPEVTALRAVLAEALQIPATASYFAHLMAGADVRYDTDNNHPLSGKLVPDWALDDGRRIAELLHAARPVLLVKPAGAPLATTLAGIRIDVIEADCTDAPAAVLLRPDGYVAWASDHGDDDGLVAAAERWFGTS